MRFKDLYIQTIHSIFNNNEKLKTVYAKLWNIHNLKYYSAINTLPKFLMTWEHKLSEMSIQSMCL